MSPAPAESEPGELRPESKNWALGAHLSALSGLFGVPVGNILGPLIVWLVKRNDDPYVERHAKEALNFNISIFIYEIVLVAAGIILLIVLIGILLLIAAAALGIAWLVFVIIAAIAASRGEEYQYPLTIRLVS
ncbi:MAG: DUF4870 domain-containing protein [Acidimicrobiia bacterium]